MRKQEDLIRERDWDLLIILDACRYDYFENVYEEYLSGELKKVISPASNTYEWCKEILEKNDFSDVVCVSANPHVNSVNKVRDFDPRRRFKRIIDVWLSDWGDKIPTVRPNVMAERVKEVLEEYDGKVMAWFIQPHFPALMLDISGTSPFLIGTLHRLRIYSILDEVIMRLPTPLLRKWWQFQMRKGEKVSPDKAIFAELGVEKMREAYKQNLKMALESVSEVVETARRRKVVVTSDHGELLGESGFMGKKIGHPARCRYKGLIEVPWFEVSTEGEKAI